MSQVNTNIVTNTYVAVSPVDYEDVQAALNSDTFHTLGMVREITHTDEELPAYSLSIQSGDKWVSEIIAGLLGVPDLRGVSFSVLISTTINGVTQVSLLRGCGAVCTRTLGMDFLVLDKVTGRGTGLLMHRSKSETRTSSAMYIPVLLPEQRKHLIGVTTLVDMMQHNHLEFQNVLSSAANDPITFDAISWLLSAQHRREGRTTLLTQCVFTKALQNPGTWITFHDEHGAISDMVRELRVLLEHYGIRGEVVGKKICVVGVDPSDVAYEVHYNEIRDMFSGAV